jgi:hypothetical protein
MPNAVRAFGHLPTLHAFCALFGAAGAARLAGAPDWIVLAPVAVFVLYCAARPSKRLEVFFNACAPGAVGALLHDIAGVSPLWGLAAIPVVLVNLREIDRDAKLTPRR